MSQTRERTALGRLLDPVTECLTLQSARRLVEPRAEPELQQRIEVLADKCSEGQLTAEESEEYETYVRAIQIISILQAKARRLLGEPTS